MNEIIEQIKKELGRLIRSIIDTGSEDGIEIAGTNGRYIYLKYFAGSPFMKWEAYENDGDLIGRGHMHEETEWRRGLGPVLKKVLVGKNAATRIERMAMRVASSFIKE